VYEQINSDAACSLPLRITQLSWVILFPSITSQEGIQNSRIPRESGKKVEVNLITRESKTNTGIQKPLRPILLQRCGAPLRKEKGKRKKKERENIVV
jgi:hypothetical protein